MSIRLCPRQLLERVAALQKQCRKEQEGCVSLKHEFGESRAAFERRAPTAEARAVKESEILFEIRERRGHDNPTRRLRAQRDALRRESDEREQAVSQLKIALKSEETHRAQIRATVKQEVARKHV